MKRNLVSIGLVILGCLFLFALNIDSVFAAEEDTGVATDITVVSEEKAVEVEDEELPADVALDERVTTEDLEAVEANVLPGSAFHVFKRFGWTMREIFETDPVADAELKIQHANQELSELKQLIDERGFTDVNPDTINASMARFEGRLENVNNVAEALKERKETDPEAVNTLLNNLTDKQFKYQKVLESIERDVIKEKEENPDASDKIENVFVKISETKNKALEHFGDVIGTVEEDNSEKIAERIIRVADKQDGSEFKHLKNLEVLKRLEGQAPKGVRGAIELAQENTLKFFNRDIASLPEEDRAERFEQYNKFNYGDETRQLSFLDDLKSLDGISPEILKKIEEVKEFAISKFEKKMSEFKQPDVLENYIGHLSGENFNDMVLAEQLASRVVFEDRPEIKQRMDDIRDRSVKEFTARFTDPESQSQIAKFQELERILEERPGDPKVMKMMQEFEAQVRSDPSKAEFLSQIDQLEDKMRFELENKFRQEGDKYLDRIGTLDPRDFEVYKQFSGENFLPADLAEKFLDHGVTQYRDYMKNVDNPEQFDRFNTKFSNIPRSTINDIGQRDKGFGEAMQFKRQAMEKLRFEEERKLEVKRQAVDYSERELSHQLDRARRQADEEFWQQVNSIPYENFNERKELFKEKQQTDLARLNEEHNARLEMFNKRLTLDPWCDNSCQQIQKQFIDQEFRHQKERIQDDYISQQKQIEFDLGREKQNNPLFGECNDPKSCETYCQNNSNIPECQGFFHEPVIFNDDFNVKKDYNCGPGKYFDFSVNGCIQDPYYRAPTDFTQCPFGSRWNKERGFCAQDITSTSTTNKLLNQPKVDCGQDGYFDFRENRCVSYNIAPSCPPGSYLGPFGKCKQENFQCPDYSVVDMSCPNAGEYRDKFIDNNGCTAFGACRIIGQKYQCPDIATMYPAPCPDGQPRNIITDSNGCQAFGECKGGFIPPVTCDAYFEGYEYNPSTTRCELRSITGCSNPYKYRSITECQNGNITGTVPAYPTSSNWANHTWYFSDGGSSSSSILNRTDAEYTNYIAGIEAQCKTIPQSKFGWKSGAGNDASSNWQNFGIPDCSGAAQPNTYPVYPTTTYPSSDGECSTLQDIIPGCHIMPESPSVRFNSAMNQYVQVGTRTIQSCSASSIPGCTSYYSNTTTSGYCGDNACGSSETSSSCPSDCGSSGTVSGSMSRCFYPNATINSAPTGYTVWCEADYYNCHQGDPSGATVSLTNLSLGAPSSCESGYTGNNATTNTITTSSSGYCGNNVCNSYETTSSCPADCGSASTDTSTYCPPPAYWDFATNSCKYDASTTNTSSTYCPSPSYWDPAINGCAPGTPTTSTTCMTAANFGTCNNGYQYDGSGCVTGCIPPPVEVYVPPAPGPAPEPAPEPPPSANIWSALKALFGL